MAVPPLVPEVKLHLITPECRLWRAGEKDLDALGIGAPYWAFAWPGGQALARFILDHPDHVYGSRVLDFGSGSGLVAIAAKMAGAREVVAADVDPVSCEAIALNAALNGVRVTPTSRDLTDSVPARWDAILAGDVCYEREQASSVMGWLREAAGGGAHVLVADPGRGNLDEAHLVALERYDAPADVDIGGVHTRSTTIYYVIP